MFGLVVNFNFLVLTDPLTWMQACKLSLRINLLKADNVKRNYAELLQPNRHLL